MQSRVEARAYAYDERIHPCLMDVSIFISSSDGYALYMYVQIPTRNVAYIPFSMIMLSMGYPATGHLRKNDFPATADNFGIGRT